MILFIISVNMVLFIISVNMILFIISVNMILFIIGINMIFSEILLKKTELLSERMYGIGFSIVIFAVIS